MTTSGNAYKDKTSDSSIKEAINETIDLLKLNPAKFKAVYSDGSTILFDTYEEAMDFYSRDGKCKLFVI